MANATRRFLAESVASDVWHGILCWLCSVSSSLVVTNPSPGGIHLPASLARDLGPPISIASVSEWSGTVLFGGRVAERLTFGLRPGVAAALFEASQSPWGWLGPNLPEDLTFLRSDGSELAASVTHEHEFWFDLDTVEMKHLCAAVPGIVLQPESE